MEGAERGQQPPDPGPPARLSLELGVDIDVELAVLALTHRSYAYENGGLPTNERLEFLGDSVLGIVVTEQLYRSHPNLPEGQLAKLRASIVNMHALAGVARAMNLGSMVRLGRGEELTGGRDKASILADAVEALLGALYLQFGLEGTRSVIHRLFNELIVTAPSLGAGLDWKTSLQELAAAEGLGMPVYQVDEQGPDHLKTFSAVVLVGGAPHGDGIGRTKKEAEQQAASAAYETLTTDSAETLDADPVDAGPAEAGLGAAGPADAGSAAADPADSH
jgi:ribonuclease-3